MQEIKPPTYELDSVSPDLTPEVLDKNIKANFAKRVNYINDRLSEKYVDIANIFKGNSDVDNILSLWKSVLKTTDQRLYFEAVKERAVSYEQMPTDFVTLGLNDIDYFKVSDGFNILKNENKRIQDFLNSDEYKDLPKKAKRAKLVELFNKRDSLIPDLVFITSLTIDDLPTSEVMKIDALHAIGEHEAAKELSGKCLTSFKRKAIDEYRLSVENKVKFNRESFRSFS